MQPRNGWHTRHMDCYVEPREAPTRGTDMTRSTAAPRTWPLASVGDRGWQRAERGHQTRASDKKLGIMADSG